MTNIHTVIGKQETEQFDKICEERKCTRYALAKEAIAHFLSRDQPKGTQEQRTQAAVQTADRELKKLKIEKTRAAEDFSEGDEPLGDMVEDLSPNSEVGRPPSEPNLKNPTLSTDSKSNGKNSQKKLSILNIYA